MYANTAAVSRPEITVFLEEARDIEKFFIAEKLCPVHNVSARAGRYPRIRIDKGELMKKDVTDRGPSGTYNEVSQKFEYDTYDCHDRGLVERVDDANVAEMKSFFDMEMITAKLIKRKMMIDHEVRVANLVMDPTQFNATAASVDYTEANLATFDFPRDLNDALARLEEVGVEPNTMVISRDLWNRIRRSTLLQTYLFNNLNTAGKRLIKESDIADGFGVENVIVAKPKYDSAPKGRNKVLTPIWTSDYIFLGKTAGGDFQNGGIGRTLVWGADAPGGLYTTEAWRDENRRGDMLRVRTHTSEKVIDQTNGQLITTGFSS